MKTRLGRAAYVLSISSLLFWVGHTQALTTSSFDSFTSPVPEPRFGLSFDMATFSLWGNSNNNHSATVVNFDLSGNPISQFDTQPPTSFNTIGVAVNQRTGSEQRLYYYQNLGRRLFEALPDGTIQSTTMLPFGYQGYVGAIAFDPASGLIVAPREGNALVGATEGFTFIQPGVGIVSEVDFDFRGRQLFRLGFDLTISDFWVLDPIRSQVLQIDRTSLTLTGILRLPDPGAQDYRGLAIDPQAGLLYLNFLPTDGEVRIFSVMDVGPVPLPPSFYLFGSALLGLIGTIARSKKPA